MNKLHYDREYLLDFLKQLRDGLLTPMNPFDRAEWVAKMGYATTALISLAEKEGKP